MGYMRRYLYSILAATAALVLVLSVIAFRHYLPYTGTNLIPKEPPEVVLAMDDVYLVGLGSDGKLWSAKAGKVEIGQNRSVATVTGIRDGKVFDKGKLTLELKAGSAFYDTFTKDLQLGGGVEIRGRDGQKVTGSGANWNSTTLTLRSIGQVNFESGRSKVTAQNLVADLNKKELEMWNVSMLFAVDDLDKSAVREAIPYAE